MPNDYIKHSKGVSHNETGLGVVGFCVVSIQARHIWNIHLIFGPLFSSCLLMDKAVLRVLCVAEARIIQLYTMNVLFYTCIPDLLKLSPAL